MMDKKKCDEILEEFDYIWSTKYNMTHRAAAELTIALQVKKLKKEE